MTVLLGPSDADHFRVKVGRYGDRWYTDPLPACELADTSEEVWPSVSSVKKASGSDWSFVALKRAAMADLTGIEAQSFDERYERFKAANKLGLQSAGERGTNVHRYFEQGLREGTVSVPWIPNEPGAEYFDAVRAFFATYQPKLIAAEVVAICRDLHGVGYGGTGDAIIEINGGTYWVDWKSRGADSDHGAYPEEAAQIAGYAGADYMIVEGDHGPERRRIPPLDGGLIVSIKPDGFRCYPINLELAGQHWRAMHAWWVARRSEREAVGKPWAPRKATKVSAAGTAGSDIPTAATVDKAEGVADVPVNAAVTPSAACGHVDGGPVTCDICRSKTSQTNETIKPAARGGATWCPPLGNTEPFDEGPDVEPTQVETLQRVYERLPHNQTVLVNNWMTATKKDGGRRLSIRQRPSLWRWSVVRALIKCARIEADDELMRWMLYGATSALHCLSESIPLGTLFASLTVDQANALADLADGITAGTIAVTFDGGGVPQFNTAT